MKDKTYVQKLDALQNEVTHFLCTEFYNIRIHWIESDFYPCSVLQINKQNLQFNLDDDRILIEFDGNELIDNQGYKYSLNVLSIDQLCILADAIKSRKF